MKSHTKKLGLTLAAAVALVAASTGGAVADRLITSADVENNSLRAVDLAPSSVAKSELASGAVGWGKLNQPTKAKLKKMGGKDVLGSSVVARQTDKVNVALVGGSFAQRATQADTYDLEPGTYLVSTDGFFITNAATSGKTRMQVAVRGVDGSQWGKDLGTCFTGLVSTLANREATCNTTRTVVIDTPTTVNVKVFGYADDQGSADSALVDAYVTTSVVRVG